jgi:DNA-binding CsgD family transcriptional regulator
MGGYRGVLSITEEINGGKNTQSIDTKILMGQFFQLPEKKSICLSPREIEVLQWLKGGKSSWDISIILRISERTVNFHIRNIMQKLDALNRTQAVAVAIEMGLLDIY